MTGPPHDGHGECSYFCCFRGHMRLQVEVEAQLPTAGRRAAPLPSALSDNDLYAPRAGSPVDGVGFLTEVDQHVQMSQSVLVLEETRPKTQSDIAAPSNQPFPWGQPPCMVTEVKHLEQGFLTFFGS